MPRSNTSGGIGKVKTTDLLIDSPEWVLPTRTPEGERLRGLQNQRTGSPASAEGNEMLLRFSMNRRPIHELELPAVAVVESGQRFEIGVHSVIQLPHGTSQGIDDDHSDQAADRAAQGWAA